MTATAHTHPGAWTRAHRAALTIVALTLALAAALVILGLRLAAGDPSSPVVGTGSTAVLHSVDNGCMLARPGQPC
jgi:hypothetical protein